MPKNDGKYADNNNYIINLRSLKNFKTEIYKQRRPTKKFHQASFEQFSELQSEKMFQNIQL